MPVTLKTGVMKYRKSDGTYSVMDALMQEPTTDQISAIETVGQEQVDAVEQKGQDILDSLPEDYTELETDVGVLKSAIEDLEAGSLSALGATAGQVPVADGLGSWAWGAQAGGTQTIQVPGTTPVITAVANTQYICGEVATLDITLPASGCIDVVFESGSTPTVLTVTPPTGQTMHWPDWFDPTSLDANTRYEINIDNAYGVVGMWT